jgi:hypothetical protein
MSGTTVGGIAIPVFAVDNATAVINRISKQVSNLTAPTQRFGQATRAAADARPILALSQGMKGLGAAAFTVFKNFERAVPLLAVLAAPAAIVASVVALERRWSELGQVIYNTSARLGITTTSLTAWQGAAKLGGASAEDMTAGLASLDEKLRGATFRGDGNAIQAFRALGVNFGVMGSKARVADDAMGDVAEGLKRVNDEQGRGAALRLAQALGLDSMFAQLVQGKAAWEANIADAKRLGLALTPDMIDRATKLHNSIARVGGAVGGFANRISDALSPAITPVLNQMADWIALDGDWIAQDIGSDIRKLGEWLKGIDWAGATKDAERFWEANRGQWFPEPKKNTPFGPQNNPELAGGGGPGAGEDQPSILERLRRQLFPFLYREPGGSPHRSGSPGWPGFFWHGGRSSGGSAPGLDPQIEQEVRRDARLAGLNEDHMVALFRTEHGGFANVSKAGAFGPAQLMPGTAESLGLATSPNDIRYSWRKNVLGGIEYYKKQLDRYGQYPVADAAYNAGPDNRGVKLFGRTGQRFALPDETNNYVDTIARTENKGSVDINVHVSHDGAPRVSATSRGIATTPRVSMPMGAS